MISIPNLGEAAQAIDDVAFHTKNKVKKFKLHITNIPGRDGSGEYALVLPFEVYHDKPTSAMDFFPAPMAARSYHRVAVVINDKSECFYMHIYIPKKTKVGQQLVPHAHLYRLLYGDDKDGKHMPLTPDYCFGLRHPIHWGPVLLEVGAALAHAAGANFMTLVDGSFVETCQKRQISLRRLQNLKDKPSFYEKHGFVFTTTPLLNQLSHHDTHDQAQVTLLQIQARYEDDRHACLARKPSTIFNHGFCTLPLGLCRTGVTAATAGQLVAEGLLHKNDNACKAWDYLKPDHDTCLSHPLGTNDPYDDWMAVRLFDLDPPKITLTPVVRRGSGRRRR
jgi:hypothetical protein